MAQDKGRSKAQSFSKIIEDNGIQLRTVKGERNELGLKQAQLVMESVYE
jgi:hypothetical protein